MHTEEKEASHASCVGRGKGVLQCDAHVVLRSMPIKASHHSSLKSTSSIQGQWLLIQVLLSAVRTQHNLRHLVDIFIQNALQHSIGEIMPDRVTKQVYASGLCKNIVE